MPSPRLLPALLLTLLAPLASAQLHPVGPDLYLDDIAHAPAVAVHADGSFAVAWADPGDGDPLRGTIRLRRFTADGTAVGPMVVVAEYLAGIAGHAAPPVDLVIAADRSAFVLWSGPAIEDPQRPTPYLRRILHDGTPSPWTLRVAGHNPMPAFGPRLALRPDGLMVGAWIGVHPDGRSTDVFAIRLNQHGQHYLPAVRVHAAEDDAQRLGDVAAAADGRFAVAWRTTASGGTERLRVRVFGSEAQPLAAEVDLGPVRPAEAPHGGLDERPGPALAALPGGRWVIAWEGEGDPGTVTHGGAALARLLGPLGAPAGEPFRLAGTVRGEQDSPALTATPDGFVAAWVDRVRSDTHDFRGVLGRTFDAGGQPTSDEYQMALDSRRDRYAPVLAAAAGGGVVATLEADPWTEARSLEVRRLANTGPGALPLPQGPPRDLGTSAGSIDLAPHRDGYLAVWSEIRPPGSPGGDVVLGQRLQADGDPANTRFALGSYLADERSGPPQVASGAASGTAVVAWTGRRPETGTPGVYARLLDADNFFLTAPFLVSGEGPRARRAPRVAMTPEGGFLIAWTAEIDDRDDGTGDSDVFARRFHADGTPTGSPFRVNTWPGGRQELTGLAIDGEGLALAVWRGWNEVDSRWEVFVARIHPGDKVDLEQLVSDDPDPARNSEGEATVERLADGAWLVAFHDGRDVVGRRYRSRRAQFGPVSAERVLHRDHPGVQTRPALAARPDGGFVLLWTADCDPRVPAAGCTGAASPDGSGSAVFARLFDADLWPRRELPVADDPTGFQDGAAVAVNGPGVLAAWITGDRGTGVGPRPPVASVRSLAVRGCPGDPDGSTVCLAGGRFLLEVEWEDFQGGRGRGSGIVRGDDWSTFWFTRPANIELAVKVLDGRPVNGHWWVFYAALTNMPFRLWVHDLESGASRLYENPPRHFASRGDTLAFPEAAPQAANAGAPAAAPQALAGSAPAVAGSALSASDAAAWNAGWTASGEAPPPKSPAAGSPAVFLAIPATAGDAPPCEAGATRLCLQGAAFGVEIDWRDFSGNGGVARAEPLSSDSGYFWFLRPGNPEVLVKVLDGRPVNGHYWVFFAALTNLPYELRVTRAASGETVVYENPARHFASRGDTTAFPEPPTWNPSP